MAKIKIDTKKYKEAYEKYLKEMDSKKEDILKKASVQFAQWASVYTPPDLKEKTISKELYERKILYLPNEIKRSKNRFAKQDITALRNGYRYKIYKKVPLTRNFTVEYFKKLNSTLKRALKIKNRGLLRASYGSNLESIGEKIPSNIKRLLSKSRNLKKLARFNQFSYDESDGISKISIKNLAADAEKNQSFARLAIREGDKHAESYIKRILRKTQKESVKL